MVLGFIGAKRAASRWFVFFGAVGLWMHLALVGQLRFTELNHHDQIHPLLSSMMLDITLTGRGATLAGRDEIGGRAVYRSLALIGSPFRKGGSSSFLFVFEEIVS